MQSSVRRNQTMDLTPFKIDIDELINEFSKSNSTTLADMKRIWLSRKFSFIYEARPTTNVPFFIQSLFSLAIDYMISTDSLSQRLGGLYCLYYLFAIQPFKPPFKVYLSLGDLKRLKDLVVRAKEENIMVVPALVKRMLESNMFLYGAVEANGLSITERLNEIANRENAGVKVAYEKLFANTPMDRFLQTDLGAELGVKRMKKLSTEYAASKELAIEEAGKMVDVQDIKQTAESKDSAVHVMEKAAGDWKTQKELFYQNTKFNQHAGGGSQDMCCQSDGTVDEFTQELEDVLERNDQTVDLSPKQEEEDDGEFTKKVEDILARRGQRK